MTAATQTGTALSAPRVRVVTAASLFDGHDAAINIMRRLIQAQGAEVIHLGHNRSVLDIVRAAIQEDADAIAISAATVRNIKQNLFGAFVYNTLGIPVAAGILYPFIGLLLNPIIAGAAMAMSSLTVVSNANRLRWFRCSERGAVT